MRRDLEKVRSQLRISALERVRLLVEMQEGKLVFQMGCLSCDEVMDWDEAQGWWRCSTCTQEVTRQEAMDVFRACHAALGWLLRDEPAVTDEAVQSGKGRWREKLFDRMKRSS